MGACGTWAGVLLQVCLGDVCPVMSIDPPEKRGEISWGGEPREEHLVDQ